MIGNQIDESICDINLRTGPKTGRGRRREAVVTANQKTACAAACSTEVNSLTALADICAKTREQLGRTPNLALLFFSAHHRDATSALAAEACRSLDTENVIGCSCEGVACRGREIEGQAAMSLWVAHLPAVEVVPMHLHYEHTAEGDTFTGWPEALPEVWPDGSTLVMLGDPFSFAADRFLSRINEDQPGRTVVGGMASAARRPGENQLIKGRQATQQGAVGVLLQGDSGVYSVVSQGCRPIGAHFVITRAEDNVIHELGGVPAYERLQQVYATLATSEQEMVRQGLHLGRVVNEYQDRFEQGDFLVRNVLGVDPKSGALAIGDYVRPGQTVQFHVRDAQTADAELRQLLAKAAAEEASPQGALLFTCNGRGTRLFSEPHHDAAAIEKTMGPIPVAGFFAAGELGPIGGKSFVHGFTASIAVFS
jgi:small ligand-binding sensory domain FIST